jgi:archaellum component FlaC
MNITGDKLKKELEQLNVKISKLSRDLNKSNSRKFNKFTSKTMDNIATVFEEIKHTFASLFYD